MKKFRIMILAVTAIFISSMVGCSSEGMNEDKTSDKQTVNLTLWGEENDIDLLSDIVTSFKEEYKDQADFNITIEGHKESEAKEDILKDIHNGPDVFTFVDDQVSTLAAAGVLESVSDEDVEDIKNNDVEGSVSAVTINDKLYAYPLTADNGYFLFYNKKYISDSDAGSLDSILNIADSNNKKIIMDLSSGWYLYSFFGNTGLKVGLNTDGRTNYCNWNTSEGEVSGLDVAKYINSMAKRNGFRSGGDDDIISGIQDGNVIAAVSGVWSANKIKEILGNDYGAAKMPEYKVAGKNIQMASFSGYKLMGVNSYSENREWANKLAKWVASEDNQILRFEKRGQGPSNINAAKSDEVGKSPAIQALLAQSEYSQLQRIGNTYWDPVKNFGDSLASGTVSDGELQNMLDKMTQQITVSTIKQ